MIHIIDANNLSGKLNILEEDNFDLKLIELIKEYNKFDKKYVLVFDSSDPMGDKVKQGSMTIIYTPRDNYYKSADDKILELVREYIKVEEVKVITDDIELTEKIEKMENKRIIIERASEFAKKLLLTIDLNKEKNNENKENLSDEEVDSINKELLNIWK